MENVSSKLGKKILSALIDDGIINDDVTLSFQTKVIEGKVKDFEWITAFTQRFDKLNALEDETK